jgi:hypothetical protein
LIRGTRRITRGLDALDGDAHTGSEGRGGPTAVTISNDVDTDAATVVVPPMNVMPIDLRVHGGWTRHINAAGDESWTVWSRESGQADGLCLNRVVAAGDDPVGAENPVTSCDVRVLVEEAAEPVSPEDVDGGAGGSRGVAHGRALMHGSVRAVGVVVLRVLRSTTSRWRLPVIRMWSRHSRRRVPMKRSAIAFARGARTGVRMMRMSAPVNTARTGC